MGKGSEIATSGGESGRKAVVTAAPVTPADKPAVTLAGPPSHRELVEEFLRGKAPTTLLAYRGDLADFAGFLGVATIDEAARELLSHGHGAANRMILRYKNGLLERAPKARIKRTQTAADAKKTTTLSTATVARRLAAVRSLVRLARLLGMIEWTIDVSSPKVERVKDARGPRREGVRALKTELESRDDAKGPRDGAILHLLYDLGLRRAEVLELDLEHVDLTKGEVSIMGKGRKARERLTMPPPTKAALAAWIESRGKAPGPLFVSFDRKRNKSRLTARGIYYVIQTAGRKADVKARPHGLRHSAITAAMDACSGDLRKVARFSRHRDWRTLAAYYDEWRDEAGEVAAKVADTLGPDEVPPSTDAPT